MGVTNKMYNLYIFIKKTSALFSMLKWLKKVPYYDKLFTI